MEPSVENYDDVIELRPYFYSLPIFRINYEKPIIKRITKIIEKKDLLLPAKI